MDTPRNHSEIEHKYEGEDVSDNAFAVACQLRQPERFLHVSGPDAYYEQGTNVIRHRLSGGAGELTVKRRKSTDSTEDRQEIDLFFSPKNSIIDVQAFLAATGWNRTFTIMKDCRIYWFPPEASEQFGGKAEVSVVLYDCWRVGDGRDGEDRRRIVEVEIEKGSKVSKKVARSILLGWRDFLIANGVRLGDRINDSLYEMYSGKKYGTVA